MTRSYDAVVIGSGINGMVAAAELATAGWTVALVERNTRIGGFIATEERTEPGYLHDTYSSWHPQFVSGAAYAALGTALHECGLEFVNTEEELCATATDDGEVSLAYRSVRRTAAGLGCGEDGRTYRRHLQWVTDNAAAIGALMSGELRSLASVRTAMALFWSNGVDGSQQRLRDGLTSGRSWCRREFAGPEVDRLWVPWLLHAGLSPDHASGGLLLPLFAGNLHAAGLPVVVGGSGRLVEAFRELLHSLDVEVMTGTTVDGIVLADGRATGVTCGGETIGAETAVLASVTPTALYGSLLPPGTVERQIAVEAEHFRYGRAALQVHVALDAPLRWHDERLNRTPVVHLSDGSASTGVACAEAEAGLLPACPTVVVGQQHVLDPSRVPEGAASLWIQLLEMPWEPRGDAGGELDVSAGWTRTLADGVATRALDRLARHVDGLRAAVRAVDVLHPGDLAGYNVNAIGGDPYGGDMQLDQAFLWRPLPASGGHETTVPNLWHIGASTHPGAGLGGASGHLVAQRLLASPGTAGRARLTGPRRVLRVVRPARLAQAGTGSRSR
ncbi:Phytoene dehydrogenase-related protein [Geodermatophilus dictyosporus]|uniref:Pyridine nucleotide-disulfide oxidoreductase domain-containing protein 2 n=1 Tax=Geodermatophilus dictyosporus TaxID=1523247 RepID=A0A1I5JQ85_9ACTN|nr:NAD(P)/FAD-dependent oxidoreductase [Geodermatophilus dictyosporus]SFO74972.1 Phytoene dehydrogenase-related protein [Geodermatophilus dictyosporus]